MKVTLIPDKCTDCRECSQVLCPEGNVIKTLEWGNCVGCGACLLLCPEKALEFDKNTNIQKDNLKRVSVNKKDFSVSGLVKDALNAAGIKTSKFPPENENDIFMPCCTGGCWSCAVKIDGKYALSCITPLCDDMKIQVLENPPPIRSVSGFGAHTVGGVGTPYKLKKMSGPVEAVCFTHGCNLQCPQCQNYKVAFTPSGHLLESEETAQILLGIKEQYQLNRVAISGGESTLNREWLISTIKLIRESDPAVKIHLDTNGTIISPDYIDAIVKAGVTDIGVDLKAVRISSFMYITGLEDEKLAEKYMKTAWNSVKYIADQYCENVFLGVGIPYNKALISPEEVEEMGYRISTIDSDMQVCVLDYRGEFRRKNLIQPSVQEMLEIKNILDGTGLKKVIVQTSEGIMGP
jgi:pyruvate formate lyase activating enzyme